jgi:Raf kinase inhibitor-like YbhB/YbcL family protein
MRTFYSLLLIMLIFCACQERTMNSLTTTQGTNTSIKMSSAAFTDGALIPKQYTCDGANISPPLSWTNVPVKARSLALIVSDPDAPNGIFTHWVLFNLTVTTRELPENIPAHEALEGGARQGTNSFERIGYSGPCPPPNDKAHRYVFKLYALDIELTLAASTTKEVLEKAMTGHILAEGELTGKYKR